MWPVVLAAARASIELMRRTSFHPHAVSLPQITLTDQWPARCLRSLYHGSRPFGRFKTAFSARRYNSTRNNGRGWRFRVAMLSRCRHLWSLSQITKRTFCLEQRVDVPLYDGTTYDNVTWQHYSAARQNCNRPRGVNRLMSPWADIARRYPDRRHAHGASDQFELAVVHLKPCCDYVCLR